MKKILYQFFIVVFSLFCVSCNIAPPVILTENKETVALKEMVTSTPTSVPISKSSFGTSYNPTPTQTPTKPAWLIRVLTPSSTPTITPTPTSVPPPSVKDILEQDRAIDYSHNLLQQELSPIAISAKDKSRFVLIQYPNGDQGSFVTLCCLSGPLGGGVYIYRIKNDKAEVAYQSVEIVQWGVNVTTEGEYQYTDIEFLKLFDDIDDQIIKITGWGYSGTGNRTSGIFNIFRISSDGPEIIFGGIEGHTHDPTGPRNIEDIGEKILYNYQFVDLDADGRLDIVEERTQCEYQVRYAEGVWEQLSCVSSPQKTYRFNGTKYVEIE